ncbi:hypothetical protein NPIL_36821 [Nephila pilipes]|uniref:Uncharacterized protein n=1 Tax=Nephila pilipes TaxID=299642 RepID=A0A8X6NVD1_NEPPI|nr:hypothetical protein NPIL_36821 [Nephila pilipes]
MSKVPFEDHSPFVNQDGDRHNRITCMAGTSASRVGPSSITMVTVSGHNDDGSHLSRGNERSGSGPMVCPGGSFGTISGDFRYS